MNTEMLELCDDKTAGSDDRRGVCHISDVLPIVLARIAANGRDDRIRCPTPVGVACSVMPAAGQKI